MTKEELALEVIDRLKKEYLADCILITMKPGNCWLAYGWQHSVQMPGVNVVVQDLVCQISDVGRTAAATPKKLK